MKKIATDPEALLRIKGLRVTSPRKAISNLFSEECNPMNAEMIKKRLGKMDLVTIYRTLTSLEKAEIIKKVNLHKDSVYYELNHHHHHIICTDCGTIEEFDNCDEEKLIKKATSASTKFTIVKEHSLEFFGICKDCVKG